MDHEIFISIWRDLLGDDIILPYNLAASLLLKPVAFPQLRIVVVMCNLLSRFKRGCKK